MPQQRVVSWAVSCGTVDRAFASKHRLHGFKSTGKCLYRIVTRASSFHVAYPAPIMKPGQDALTAQSSTKNESIKENISLSLSLWKIFSYSRPNYSHCVDWSNNNNRILLIKVFRTTTPPSSIQNNSFRL